jgi:hypothetical protein
MRFKNFQNLTEQLVKLRPGALKGENSNTDELRIDILARLIKDKTPLELAAGGYFTVTDIDDALKQIEIFKKLGKAFNLHSNGKTISSSELGKSAVFGGGKGSGGGSTNTKITESYACCMCQAMLDHGIHDPDFFTSDIIKEAYKKVKVDATLEKVLTTSDSWKKTSYYSAKILIKENYINKSHVFHRKSREMIQLYARKDAAFKNTGFKTLKDDKWNPGDIWAIPKGFNIKKLDVSSIGAFNNDLLELFNDRVVVGISLKKTKKETPYIGEYNIDDGHHPYNITYQTCYLDSKGGSFWSSKGATIEYKGSRYSRLILKDNKRGGNVKAEIKGIEAFGGGISWGGAKGSSGMVDFIKDYLGIKLPKHTGGITTQAKAISNGNEKEIQNFYKMFQHFNKRDRWGITKEQFLAQLKKQKWHWVSAKLACLYVCHALDTKGGPKVHECVNDLVNYAGSTKKESGPFVKVGE